MGGGNPLKQRGEQGGVMLSKGFGGGGGKGPESLEKEDVVKHHRAGSSRIEFEIRHCNQNIGVSNRDAKRAVTTWTGLSKTNFGSKGTGPQPPTLGTDSGSGLWVLGPSDHAEKKKGSTDILGPFEGQRLKGENNSLCIFLGTPGTAKKRPPHWRSWNARFFGTREQRFSSKREAMRL